jgi:glycosyltransferase involved in cell wall biosynthesis
VNRNPLVRSVSAFFPCYNDEHSIAEMVLDVRRALVEAVDDFEIVVVDDGSTDGSAAVLRALAAEVPELRVIHHEANRGYGGALLSGFAAATKEWVFYTDGDAQYDASEILRCIDAVAGGVDVVQGWKVGRGDPWYRKAIGRAYHHTVKLLFRLPVRDTDCDFRLIHSGLLQRVELTSTSGVICVEMMHAFDRAGGRFVEVPVSHHFRPHGRSQFFRLPAIARSARQLLALWWRVTISDRRATGRTARRDRGSGSDRGSPTSPGWPDHAGG